MVRPVCGAIQWLTNAWSEFVDDFQLVSKNSKAMKRSTAIGRYGCQRTGRIRARARPEEPSAGRHGHDNNKRAMNQVEFMLALVHIACNKYVETAEMHDVSEALRRLLVHDIDPRLAKLFGSLPKRDFRDRYCYVEQVANVLRLHERSLRTLFTAISQVGGKEAGLLSIEEWLSFLRATQLIGWTCWNGTRYGAYNVTHVRGESDERKRLAA